MLNIILDDLGIGRVDVFGADWFAVEALFRRPLGPRIPHTAVLRNNQKRAAANMARFVEENSLKPDGLLRQVRMVSPVARLADLAQAA